MKILLSRTTDRISGAEIYNLYLLKSLSKFDDIQLIFSSNLKSLNKLVHSLNIPVESIDLKLDEVGTKKQLLSLLINLPRFLKIYYFLFKKSQGLDMVIFQSMNEKLILTPILKLFGKTVVWIEHGPLFITRRTSIVKFFYYLMHKFSDKIICVSKSTEIDLVHGGVTKEKIVTIYIGIDLNKFSIMEDKKRYKLKSKLHLLNKKIICYLGTVNKDKGIYEFLDVANIICKERDDVTFLVIGEGELLSTAKKIVKERNLLNSFLFTGFVEDVRDYLGISDVLLFPTHHPEGLSISLIEGAAMGIPIVATDIGGNKEIIENEESGFLFKNMSPLYIKQLIVKSLLKKKTLSKKARLIAEKKFSIINNVEKFRQTFLNISYEN